jgi:putative oxidoreductase
MNTSEWTPRILSLLRIVAALLFLEHATMKFLHFPAAIPGVPSPLPTMIIAAGTIELVTGVLMTVGLFTRIAAFVASGEMAIAYFMAHAPKSFWPAINQGEGAILFCFIFLYLAFAGGGAWSLDAAMRRSQ